MIDECLISDKHKFTLDRIFKQDETAVTIVYKPPKELAQSGLKQVTSAEWGQLVTMCNILSASDNTISPAFVFPWVNSKE